MNNGSICTVQHCFTDISAVCSSSLEWRCIVCQVFTKMPWQLLVVLKGIETEEG